MLKPSSLLTIICSYSLLSLGLLQAMDSQAPQEMRFQKRVMYFKNACSHIIRVAYYEFIDNRPGLRTGEAPLGYQSKKIQPGAEITIEFDNALDFSIIDFHGTATYQHVFHKNGFRPFMKVYCVKDANGNFVFKF